MEKLVSDTYSMKKALVKGGGGGGALQKMEIREGGKKHVEKNPVIHIRNLYIN